MKLSRKLGVVAALLVMVAAIAHAVNTFPLKPDGANAAPATVFGTPSNGISIGKTTAPNAALDVVGSAIISGSLTAGSIVSSGAFQFQSRTKAQILALVPGAAGKAWYCSDCSQTAVAVSTGSLASQVADIANRTSVIQ